VLHRWRFAIDAAVVVVVGCAVAALSSKSISWTVAGAVTFAAVFLGGACARSYGRALARALLAAGVAPAVALEVLVGLSGYHLADLFETNGHSAPGLEIYYPLFAAGVLVPAILTAVTAHALAVGWRTRSVPMDSHSNGEGLDWAPMGTSDDSASP
jgi:uncharacterized PurR-regulated membrane protein YhhQ (DUF165 family)